MAKVPMGFIYGLQNPTTNEIFYIGATTTSLTERLRVHYQHLQAALKGKRKLTNKMNYILALGKTKCKIKLFDIVIDEDLHILERKYIAIYRKSNPALTNMTDGGNGNYTSKYYSEREKKIYGEKISKALKGRPKPKGFAEAMSKARKGKGNPRAKEIKNGGIVIFSKHCLKPEMMFKFGFEVNDYFDNKHAYSNIFKFVNSPTNFPYGFSCKWYKDCEKPIQDIVRQKYENTFI